MDKSNLNVERQMFTGKIIDDIAVLSFTDKPLQQTINLNAKKELFSYIDLIASVMMSKCF